MRVVLERRLGVDPSEHPDVAVGAPRGKLAGLADGHHRGGGEDAPDAGVGPEPAHQQPPDGEHQRTADDEGQGDHAAMIAQARAAAGSGRRWGNRRPEGTYSTRGP
jgi:hypothetical protein